MKYRLNLIKLSSILIYLIPLALLTGPFLPDLFLTVTGFIFIYLSIKNKKWFYYRSKFFLFFILFYIYLNLISTFSNNPLFSLESSFVYLRYGIFSLAVWFIIDNNNNFIKNFTLILLLVFTIAIIDGLLQHFLDRSIFGYTYEHQRMSLLLNDKLILGGYLARMLPLLIAVLLYSFSKNKNIIYVQGILIITSICVIILTSERTAIALIILFLFLFIILLPKKRIYTLSILILSSLAIFFIIIFNEDVKNRVVNMTINQLGINFGDRSMNLISVNHEPLIKTSYELFLKNPIFGIGPNTFRLECASISQSSNISNCSTHPHNIYIQLLAETGIVGFSFIFGLLLYVLHKVLRQTFANYFNKKLPYSDYQSLLIISFLITLWPLVPSNNFFNNWINVIYFLPVGFFLHSIYNNNKF